MSSMAAFFSRVLLGKRGGFDGELFRNKRERIFPRVTQLTKSLSR